MAGIVRHDNDLFASCTSGDGRATDIRAPLEPVECGDLKLPFGARGVDLCLVKDGEGLGGFAGECGLGLLAPLKSLSIVIEVAVDIYYVEVGAGSFVVDRVFVDEQPV